MSNVENVVVDLTNYKDRFGDRVAPDQYTVVVDDVETTKSNQGNPMINIWLRILDGDFKDSVIVDRLTITEKAMFRVVDFMKAIAMPTPKKRFNVNPRSFVGKKLIIDVADGEPYNNRVKSEVKGYTRIMGASAGVEGSAPVEDEFWDAGSTGAGPAEGADAPTDEPTDIVVDGSGLDEFATEAPTAPQVEDEPVAEAPISDTAVSDTPTSEAPADDDGTVDLDKVGTLE